MENIIILLELVTLAFFVIFHGTFKSKYCENIAIPELDMCLTADLATMFAILCFLVWHKSGGAESDGITLFVLNGLYLLQMTFSVMTGKNFLNKIHFTYRQQFRWTYLSFLVALWCLMLVSACYAVDLIHSLL